MKHKKIYLDYAATTPVNPGVIKAMSEVLENNFGNPSAQHHYGQEALALVDEARTQIAKFINSKSSNIIFTSGATESNNLALLGYAKSLEPQDQIIVSSIEHPSVLEPARKLAEYFMKLDLAPVDQQGCIDIESFKKLLTPATRIISTMYVNNETGIIQDLESIRDVIRAYEQENNIKIFWHVDAVQAAPYIAIDVEKLDCDALTLSAHKIYGPKGMGVLYLKNYQPSPSAFAKATVDTRLRLTSKKIKPIIHGGEQEHGLRSGTLNVASIVGMARACEFIKSDEYQAGLEKYTELRDYLWEDIKEIYPQAIWYGEGRNVTPAHFYFSLPGISNESLLILLDQQGIALSAGSACSAGAIKKSHVAEAMGLSNEEINSVIRLTLGFYISRDDIDYFLEVLKNIIKTK